jgi:hypothetical protein
MKHTKMSRRTGVRELSRALNTEVQRSDVERLEQERIDYEHRARMARTSLYGLPLAQATMPRGWIDHKIQ